MSSELYFQGNQERETVLNEHFEEWKKVKRKDEPPPHTHTHTHTHARAVSWLWRLGASYSWQLRVFSPRQATWDLWRTVWHTLGRVFLRLFRLSLVIIIPLRPHLHLCRQTCSIRLEYVHQILYKIRSCFVDSFISYRDTEKRSLENAEMGKCRYNS